jgi:hypothetical protein
MSILYTWKTCLKSTEMRVVEKASVAASLPTVKRLHIVSQFGCQLGNVEDAIEQSYSRGSLCAEASA